MSEFNRFKWERAFKADERLSSTQKLILFVLATYMNDQGFAYPSLGTVAREGSLSKRAVIENMPQIEDLDWIFRGDRSPKNTIKWFARWGGEPRSPVKEVHRGGEGDSPFRCSTFTSEAGSPVKHVHQEGEARSPGGCSTFTISVNEVHPNRPRTDQITDQEQTSGGGEESAQISNSEADENSRPAAAAQNQTLGGLESTNPYPTMGHSKDEPVDQVILETFGAYELRCSIPQAQALAMQLTAEGLTKDQSRKYVRAKMLAIGDKYGDRKAREILASDAAKWLTERQRDGPRGGNNRVAITEHSEQIRRFAAEAEERNTPDRVMETLERLTTESDDTDQGFDHDDIPF